MNNGTLLACPVCAITVKAHHEKPHPQILGRLLPDGQLMILRFHSGTTIIQAANTALSCGCGFTYYIEGNHIEGTAMLTI